MFITSTILATSLITTDLRIEQVLPDNTIAVMSVGDVSQLAEHFKNLGVCDAVCETVQAMKGDQESCQITQFCTQFEGVIGDEGEISIPTGHAGMGVYPVVDFEVGSVGLGALLLLEVGDSNIGQALSKMCSEQASAMELALEQVDISGRDVWMIPNDLGPIVSQMPIPIDLSSMSQLYFTYADGYMALGTEPDAFASLFSLIDGEELEDTLEENEQYIELMNRCGTDGDLHGAVLLTNLADTFVQMDTSGMGMMILPMLKSIIGDIDGFAQAVSLSPSEDTILSGKYAILMGEGRNGFMSLIGSNSPKVDIPAFVGEDTISYTQTQVKYDEIAPLVQEITTANPLLSMQMNPQLIDQLQAGITMFTSTLGTETHVISSGSLPYSYDNYGHLIAVECVQEEQLSNALGMMLPTMGATPRDFLGNQIFTVELGSSMMIPMPINLSFSIAVGGGYAFFGNSNSVENALRSIANPKENKSNHGRHRTATIRYNGDVSGWGYGDPLTSLMIQTEMAKDLNDAMFARMEEFDPEMAEEMRADAEGANAIQDAIVKSMSLFLGPMSWNMSTDDTGFTSEIIMVKP
ncbi:MAG: hypothetical protein H8E86_03490 [Planctomycetes bacterium]|nr:hypothetical protein [Planctomycetota bacterium]